MFIFISILRSSQIFTTSRSAMVRQGSAWPPRHDTSQLVHNTAYASTFQSRASGGSLRPRQALTDQLLDLVCQNHHTRFVKTAFFRVVELPCTVCAFAQRHAQILRLVNRAARRRRASKNHPARKNGDIATLSARGGVCLGEVCSPPLQWD